MSGMAVLNFNYGRFDEVSSSSNYGRSRFPR